MAKHPIFRRLPPLLAAGLFMCTIPASALALPARYQHTPTPAVTALSPLAELADPATAFRAFSARLSGLGLDGDDIKVLWTRYGDGLFSRLESGALTAGELGYLSLANAREELLDRYAAYALAQPEMARQEVVLQVNMGLDRPFYTDTATVADPADLAVLVNKYNSLPADYVPQLVPLTGLGSGSLAAPAAQAFGEMVAAAKADGITLRSVSAYRSYSTQASLYQRYTSQSGRALADTFSAQAGYSEHQTGLALDINVATIRAHFENTPAYAWLVEHCAQYGFILRYPQGGKAITGYRFEPWHYRYVGVEAAQVCMDQGLTYEEYLALQPVAGVNTPPALLWEGQALSLGTGALMLQETLYISPLALARAAGWTCVQTVSSVQVTLGSRQITFVGGVRCQVNGVTLRQTAPVTALDGDLYLSLEDLCFALGLDCAEGDQGVALSLPWNLM